MKRTGAQLIWEVVTREGVDTVFGYPGGAILPAYDALVEYKNLHHVLTRHEQGASHAADGYARATGKVGVAVATSGPGATNLVTGIATANMDSSPIVCITGQVGSTVIGKDAFQECDITGITQPITKHNYLVTRAEDIVGVLREAFYVARSGRPGPVLVDITKDAQNQEVDFEWGDSPIRLPGYRPDLSALPEEYDRALKLLSEAKRPLFLAGQGIIMSGAEEELRKLAEAAHVPVALTLLGLGGLPTTHPANLGMMGMHGEAWVNTAIQEADLLIALGMRFDDRVTGDLATYAQNAKKIHVDIDPAEIDKNVKVDVGIVGDLRAVLTTFNERLKPQKRDAWSEYIEKSRGEAEQHDILKAAEPGGLYAAHVIDELRKLTGDNAIIVTDVGQHQMWEAQYYAHNQPRTLITSGGLGTMGFALPAAIGAKMGCPDKEVWVIAGDGGFQMTACELQTCAQENLDLNIIVINNGYLGMVRQWQEMFYDKRYSETPISSPDFVKLAEAHGLTGARVETLGDVPGAVAASQAHKGTSLTDFRVVAEDAVYPMVPTGKALDQMVRRPRKTPAIRQDT
ncbi:MAG: biosynthetic-type acetolactate synthase large subunit [Myxococcales bacterium]|nr:biosynthetic-type acetolactate synthase large subunit [Myxococcales bacterium]